MVKHLLILIVLLLLSACSSARLSYGFLDNWLQWRIDDYVSLNAEQQVFANQQLKAFHRWHRQTQLAEYSVFIDRTAALIEQETINTKQLNTYLDQVSNFWDTSVEYLLPFGVELFQQLDASQKEELLSNIKRQQASFREKNGQLTLRQKQQERLDKTEKRLNQWLGSISPAQQKTVSDWVSRIQTMDDVRDQRQLVWNSAFSEFILREQNDVDLASARQLFIDAEQLWPASYTERFDQNKTLLLNMMIKIHGQLDQSQKQFLIRRLKNYRADFTHLAAR